MRKMLMVLAVLVSGPVLAQPVTTAAEYVAAAAAGDLYERTSSGILLRDQAVAAQTRRFAATMVADHNDTSTKLRAIAEREGVRVGVPTMTRAQQAMIDELAAMPPTQRGRTYATQQVAAHREALALHQGYAGAGDNAQLRALAAETALVVEGHLKAAEALPAD